MSIQVITTVWKESKQKASPLLLLLALADNAADDGFCWPGYEYLAQKIRMSTRSVSRLIEHLEEDGELFVIRKQGEHNWYVVRVGMTNEDVIAVLKKRKMDTPDNLSALQDDQETHDKLATPNDTATPEPETEQCHANLHDPSFSNRQETPASPDSPPSEEEDVEEIVLKYQRQVEKMRGRGLSEEEQDLLRTAIQTPLFDDVAETEAMFNKTQPSIPRTAEEHREGIRRALERNAKNGNGRAGVADPSKEDNPWVDITVRSWCKIAGKDFDQMSPATKKKLAKVFREDIGSVADSGAIPVAAKIEGFPFADPWYAENVGFEWPGNGFCNKIVGMLQPDSAEDPEWKRLVESTQRKAGGSSTPRQQEQGEKIEAAINALFDETGRRREMA